MTSFVSIGVAAVIGLWILLRITRRRTPPSHPLSVTYTTSFDYQRVDVGPESLTLSTRGLVGGYLPFRRAYWDEIEAVVVYQVAPARVGILPGLFSAGFLGGGLVMLQYEAALGIGLIIGGLACLVWLADSVRPGRRTWWLVETTQGEFRFPARNRALVDHIRRNLQVDYPIPDPPS